MPDMLVRLYELDLETPLRSMLKSDDIEIRKPISPENHLVIEWVKTTFNKGWASETTAALYTRPVSCYIAKTKNEMLGFACYDATSLGVFGPTGVDEAQRGKGIGKALLMACLRDMHSKGYQYAIIGAAGPTDFYERLVGAVEIPDSWPGFYKDILQ